VDRLTLALNFIERPSIASKTASYHVLYKSFRLRLSETGAII